MEKNYKKMLKKFRLYKCASQEEINERLIGYLTYAKDDKKLLKNLYLSEKQRKDKDFMTKLYKANPYYTYICPPEKEFCNDKEFMLNYFDCRVGIDYNQNLRQLMEEYCPDFLSDPDFIMKLSEVLPNNNVIASLNLDFYTMRKLPNQYLLKQIEEWGPKILNWVPSQRIGWQNLVKKGVEKYGFEALEYFGEFKSVLRNTNLLVKAVEKDGKNGICRLQKYLSAPYAGKGIDFSSETFTLIPMFDQERIDLMTKLKENDEFWAKLKTHPNEIEDTKKVIDKTINKIRKVSLLDRDYCY